MTVTRSYSADRQIATVQFMTGHSLNVLSRADLIELRENLDEVAADRAVRVLVLSGSQEAFCGGADLTYLSGLDDAIYRDYIAIEYGLFAAVEALDFITIAAISGPCIGNGAELALACDFRICAENSRIGFPEMRVGFVAPAQRLASFLGIGRAKELLYSGKLLDARQAESLGLVTIVADDLATEVERSAEKFAQYSPSALPVTKAGIHRAYGIDGNGVGRRYDLLEQNAAWRTFKGPDFAEGSAAVLAGRRPSFNSRRGDLR